MKLEVGCGKRKTEGYIGMDISATEGVDVVHDWDDIPWPFEDGSVDEIRAFHVVEHTKNLISFIDECYRILKVGGVVDIECPYYTSKGAWQDPTHTRAITEDTFQYFNREARENGKVDHYPIKSDFTVTYQLNIDKKWFNKPKYEIGFAINHYFNVVPLINIELTKRS